MKHEYTTGYAFKEIVRFFESTNIIEYLEFDRIKENQIVKSNLNQKFVKEEELIVDNNEDKIKDISLDSNYDIVKGSIKPNENKIPKADDSNKIDKILNENIIDEDSTDKMDFD